MQPAVAVTAAAAEGHGLQGNITSSCKCHTQPPQAGCNGSGYSTWQGWLHQIHAFTAGHTCSLCMPCLGGEPLVSWWWQQAGRACQSDRPLNGVHLGEGVGGGRARMCYGLMVNFGRQRKVFPVDCHTLACVEVPASLATRQDIKQGLTQLC